MLTQNETVLLANKVVSGFEKVSVYNTEGHILHPCKSSNGLDLHYNSK